MPKGVIVNDGKTEKVKAEPVPRSMTAYKAELAAAPISKKKKRWPLRLRARHERVYPSSPST